MTPTTSQERLSGYFSLLKISAKSLHEATGIGLRQSQRIINQEIMPSTESLEKIVKAYPKISLTYIFKGV